MVVVLFGLGRALRRSDWAYRPTTLGTSVWREPLDHRLTALPKRWSNWNIKVFEYVNHTRYVLHDEDIIEVSFPLRKILAVLRGYFVKVRVVDPDRR